MKKLILVICCITLLFGCTKSPTYSLEEVKIVGHEPQREEGRGVYYKLVYEHWIYENTKTGERFILPKKFGNIGEIIKIKRYQGDLIE